ncbi:acyltransferase [Candidatus Woesearchaeota archaeon]|nr:acyltransferase [Candidatus Woesearchaeota archaeon]
MTKLVRLALIQASSSSTQAEAFNKTARFIKLAAEKRADIICLQELFATPYFAQTEDKSKLKTAEPSEGKTYHFLAQQAKLHKSILVGGSFYEKSKDGKLYNTCLIFGKKGEVICKYRKMHIPQDPLYYEQFYFKPGDLGFVQTKTEKAVIAPLICYDQWFPEAARIHALAGAEIIFYPTAIGWFDELKKEEPWSSQRWEDAMRSHASLNHVHVAAVNRVGKEGKLTFWGGSFVADAYGQVIARASSTKEEVLIVEVDLSRNNEAKDGWRFLHNRRPDAYQVLLRETTVK